MYKDWDAVFAQMKHDGEIHCPYCDALVTDDECSHISYHGFSDTPLVEEHCPKCEERFWVKEMVTRTYETFKNEDEI